MLNVRPYTPALQKLAAKFDCGNSYLNQFLRSPDALDAGVGKTFVFLTENAESIVGYYNLSCGSLDEIEGDVRYKIGGTIHIVILPLTKNSSISCRQPLPTASTCTGAMSCWRNA